MAFFVNKTYGTIVLRWGLSFLFLWFGASQVLDPSGWTSWLPAWTADVSLSPVQLVLMNGWFEIVFGIALLLGFYTRLVALILALHLLFVAYEVGYNDIGVRDFVLALCTLSLVFFSPDQLSITRGPLVAPGARPPLF